MIRSWLQISRVRRLLTSVAGGQRRRARTRPLVGARALTARHAIRADVRLGRARAARARRKRGWPPSRKSQLEVASFDPATDTWASLQPPISRQHPPLAMAMVATNDGVLLWSLWGRTKQTGTNTYAGYSGVDVFRLGPSGSWTNVTDSWPQGHTVDSPIFTGKKILLAPGQICGLALQSAAST